MNEKLFISKESLEAVMELIKTDREYCGNGIISGETPEVKLLSNGSPQVELTRKNCLFKKFSTVMWHTHAYLSKSYPSLEDIIMVHKNKVMTFSLIFTNFGVWKLISNHDLPINAQLLNNDLDYIYFKTERGRNLKNPKFPLALSKLQDDAILMGIGVYFTFWEDCADGFIL
jgi:hypothetical protein